MAPRTNPFDRLGVAISDGVAGKDLLVEASVLKRGLATRQPREIEILVANGSGRHVFLAQCRASRRAQDAHWIEQLDDKRLTLGFEFVLAISKSGFTAAGRRAANAYGIEVALLSEAEEADWSRWILNIDSMEGRHPRSCLVANLGHTMDFQSRVLDRR